LVEQDAGNGGIAISFCSKDEHAYWKDIQKLIKVDVKTVSEHQYPWHSGSLKPFVNFKPKKIQTEVAHYKSRKSAT
jgi:ATP-dependent RNA helicase RhlE